MFLKEKNYELSPEKQDLVIEVYTNIDFQVEIPDSVSSWISHIQSKAMHTEYLNLSIEANESPNSRSAKIIIKDKSYTISDTISIKQRTNNIYTGDIILKTLDDVQELATLKPQQIKGNLIIEEEDYISDISITTLSALNNCIEEIEGDFIVKSMALRNFNGLCNLKKIGGDFIINENHERQVTFTSPLTTFEGLENLESIGGNFEVINSTLISFSGLEKLSNIQGNFICDYTSRYSEYKPLKIGSYLKALTTVDGDMKLEIGVDEADSEKVNFSNLKSIGGELLLDNQNYKAPYSKGDISLPVLQTIGGNCTINKFASIEFPNIESINGNLTLNNTNNTGDIYKLKNVGDILIKDCRYLTDFCNWQSVLTEHNGTFLVTNCGYNPTKEQILNGKCSNLVSLNNKIYNITSEQQNVKVELKTNADYEIEIPDSVTSWIQTSDIQAEYFHLDISENASVNNRNAVIIIHDEHHIFVDTLLIQQAAKSLLVISQKEFYVQGQGGNITVTLQSNINYEMHIEENATTWISQITSKAMREETLIFQIAPNTEANTRKGKILFKDKNSNLSDTIHIIQSTTDSYIGNITLRTLDDVKAFAEFNYKKIVGNLIVEDDENEAITTLSLLNNRLEEIEGDLIIKSRDFSNFDGLYNLRTIRGNFIIDSYGMSDLTSFEGLNGLEQIGGNFEINASYYALNALTSFKGLENLASIGGNFEINAEGSPTLSVLASFEGLENLASIRGNFEVNSNALRSFKGLDKLKQIDGDFNIDYMNSSSSFEGLRSLESINGNFTSNQEIKVENHLSNLTTVGGNMEIQIDNYDYPDTFDANFSSLESVGGSLSLGCYSSNYGTLSLPLLQAIGGECSFQRFDLIDFPNLESINGTLEISFVNSIGTFDKLKSVGDITISYCSSLYDFCNWIPILTDYNSTFLVTNCGYNPTKYQILNGECSQTPAN